MHAKARKTERLWKKFKGICHICGKPTTAPNPLDHESDWGPSADHIIPRARGGSSHKDNLNLAHRKCNSEKHHNVDISNIVILPTMLIPGLTEPLSEEEVAKVWEERYNASKRGEYVSKKKRSPGSKQSGAGKIRDREAIKEPIEPIKKWTHW